MWRIQRIIATITAAPLLILLSLSSISQVYADTTSLPSLVVSQLKITSSNGQFMLLHNASDEPVDLGAYQIQYFNHYEVSRATTSRTISLSGVVPPHGYHMVNDGALVLCYQLSIESASLGFSTTAGLVQVVSFEQRGPGEAASPRLHDYVGWSKTAAVGAQMLPTSSTSFLQRSLDPETHHPAILNPGAGTWEPVRPSLEQQCVLERLVDATIVPTGMPLFAVGDEPPSTIVQLANPASSITGPVMPAANIGLAAPVITELLPNPNGTGNDATDEYIEIYNANNTAFDLTGFSLQTGMTTLKTYSFPPGSVLAPKRFTSFFSETTGLSLSNTASRAILRDPFMNVVNSTESYASAKDGQAWALAKSAWHWTTHATPNAANVIQQPTATKKSKASAKTKTASTRLVGAKSAAGTAASAQDEGPPAVPVHTRVLALVALVAVLYGLYEYRTDMANRYFKLRGNLTAWRQNRLKA
jgi:Lamin Tail Domain